MDLLQYLLATVAVAAAVLALAPSALAGKVTLWGCHGPAGQPLGVAPFRSGTFGDGVAGTFGNGCSGADGGLAATFDRSDPAGGSRAGWRVDVPAGATLTSVALDRTTSGFGGGPQPGDSLLYQASTSAGSLESTSLEDTSNLLLSGAADFSVGAAGDVGFGVSCGVAPGARCAASGTGTVGVEVGSLALGVTDDTPPRASVGGIENPGAGALPLTLRATDAGLGLATATAMLDGRPAVTVALGGQSCAPLASSPAGIDLALGADCPTSVTDVPLTVSAANVDDGPHRLTLTVTDIAGNATTAVDEAITVRNHLLVPGSSAIIAVGSGGRLPTTAGGPGGGGAGAGGPVCASPELTAALASTPQAVSRHGVAILWSGTRYLFTGRLTCLQGRRRVGAPPRTVVDIRSLIGAHRVVPRTGAAVYNGGIFRVLLHPRTTRTIQFRFGSGSSRRSVWIPVIVTPNRGRR